MIAEIQAIDYPKDKLYIKLTIEERDLITLHTLSMLTHCFEIVNAPYFPPQTKPKAFNYALNFAKGEHITIYGAEDVPHPLQLKATLSTFTKHKEIHCMQAHLNYYNCPSNFLTNILP